MEIILNDKNSIHVCFSKNEFGMLRSATGGPAFKGNTQRQIPSLGDWNEREALDFEKRIRDLCRIHDGDKEYIPFSRKEFFYLAHIHRQNMEELDAIEYPIITGYDYAEAEKLLDAMQSALRE